MSSEETLNLLRKQAEATDIQWKDWAQEKNFTRLLMGYLTKTPSLLLRLAMMTAVETIREGKVLVHWHIDFEKFLKAVFAWGNITDEQVFMIGTLKTSPFLLEITKLSDIECFHPDLVSFLVTAFVAGEPSKKLALPEGATMLYAFEMFYDEATAEKSRDELPMLPKFRIATTVPLNCCLNCAAEFEGNVKKNFCPKCKVATYCGVECQRLHWRKAHKDTCTKLGELCRVPYAKEECFRKGQ